MGSHAALIARLEKSEEGSRALSKGVLRALGYRITADGKGWMAEDGSRISQKSDPSRNLQDAVDLVPSKWGWSIEDTGGGLVYLKKKIPGEHGHLILAEIDGGRRSPPLGMCIAVLKAVGAEGENRG